MPAPLKRGWQSTMGRSLGVASSGIMPEIVRNRQRPDGTSPTGKPWPDTDELVYVRFTHDGPVAVDAGLSAAYEPSESMTLASARGRLTVAGSSTTTVTVYRNGSSIGTISWGSGDTLATATFADSFGGDSDLLHVQTTTAGSGAEGISIRFEFSL